MLMPIWGTTFNAPSASTSIPFCGSRLSLTHGCESLTDLLHLRGLAGVKGPPPLRIVKQGEPGIEGGAASGSRTAISLLGH